MHCTSCHENFAEVLSDNHPAVAGDTLFACFKCHKPMDSQKPESNPFSTRLHRAHIQGEGSLACSDCHAWSPGSRFGLVGVDIDYGSPSESDMDLLQKATLSWADSPFLDAMHGDKDVTCRGCHGEIFPTFGDTVENDRCLACHESYDALAQKTTPATFPDRNPHKSHLGEINCTVCHFAHSESKPYCLECHKKFQMTIPGGDKQAVLPQSS